MDKLEDTLKYLKINYTKYYESDTTTTSDAQGDPTHNPKTVTHTSNGKGKVMDTRNKNFEQKPLSNRTLPVIAPTINPRIDLRIVPIVEATQTLLTPEMKEVVSDAECGGVFFNRILRRVRRTGIDGSTPGDVFNTVIVEHAPSQVLIVIFATSPPCGLSGSLQVAKKRKSTSPGLGGNTQKWDAVVNGKLTGDLDYASIFSKLIGHKLSDSSSGDLYSRCKMNFSNDTVQNQAPDFMDMGILAINILNERGVLGTPDTRIQSPIDRYHWSAPDHISGEATAVVISAANSDHNYNNKTDFEI